MKKFLLLIFIISSLNFLLYSNIVEPKDPIVVEPKSSTDSYTKEEKKTKDNVKVIFYKGTFTNGIMKDIKGIYLNELTWEDNESGEQEILFDFIKTITIKSYRMEKYTKENLSTVYYFPYSFDITFKDGTVIKDAKGRIPQIDSFELYNSIGKRKCYTYFMRYWYEDQKIFHDNKSSNYNERPVVPNTVVVSIEFID